MNTHRFARRALAALAAFAAVGAAQAQDIPVASIQSVTGTVAFAGAPYAKAIRLAADEINAKGGIHGKKINLLERDNASDKAQAINLASGRRPAGGPWLARAWPAVTTPTSAAGGAACEPTTGTTSSSEPVPSRARRSRARARGRRRVTMARVITVGN